MMLMKNQNGQKIIQLYIPQYDEYWKYDELFITSSDYIWI